MQFRRRGTSGEIRCGRLFGETASWVRQEERGVSFDGVGGGDSDSTTEMLLLRFFFLGLLLFFFLPSLGTASSSQLPQTVAFDFLVQRK